jgi:hypothetical protein
MRGGTAMLGMIAALGGGLLWTILVVVVIVAIVIWILNRA